MQLATTVVDLREEGGQLHAVFDDGSSDDYDIVVGADGVRSWMCTKCVRRHRASRRGAGELAFPRHGYEEVSAWTMWLGAVQATS